MSNQSSAEAGPLSGALQLAAKWMQTRGVMTSAVSAYISTVPGSFLTRKAELSARLLLVGLMVRSAKGEDRGMDAALAEHLRSTTKEFLARPSLKELVDFYRQSSYTSQSGHTSVQLLVLCDLFEHLRGAAERRPIPHTYRQAARLLTRGAVHSLLQPNTQLGEEEGDEASVTTSAVEAEPVFRERRLAEALGVNWWPLSADLELPLTTADVGDALHSLQAANAWAAVARARRCALASLAALVSMMLAQDATSTSARLLSKGDYAAATATTEAGRRSSKEEASEVAACLEQCVQGGGGGLGLRLGSGTAGTGGAQGQQEEEEEELLLQDAEAEEEEEMEMEMDGGRRRGCNPQLPSLLLQLFRLWSARARPGPGGTAALSVSELAVPARLVGRLAPALEAERRTGGETSSETAVGLLTVLVAALQWLAGAMPYNESGPSGMDTADVFAEVSLAGVSLLPLLCGMADSPATSTAATIALTILTRTFLAPPTYLDTFRNHLHLATQIASIGPPGPTTVARTQALLNLLLSIASSPEGLAFLFQSNADATSAAMGKLAAVAASSSVEGARANHRVPSQQGHALSCSTIAFMTKMLHGSGTGPAPRLLRQVMGLTAEHCDWLRGPLLSMMPSADILGLTLSGSMSLGMGLNKMKAREVSLSGVAHARLVLLLLLELGKHRREWLKFHGDIVNSFIQTTLHLVASLASDGQWDASSSSSSVPPQQRCPLQCRPATPTERARAAMPAPLGLTKGWFALAAQAQAQARAKGQSAPPTASAGGSAGAVPPSALPPLSSSSPSPPWTTSSTTSTTAMALTALPGSSSSSSSSSSSAFSEDVAVGVYELLLLGLSFLCQLTGDMVNRLAEGVAAQSLQGRALQGLLLIPQTSTLHAIQEQCLGVATELASKAEFTEACARLCRSMVVCVESALLLEACHPRLPWSTAVLPSHLTAHAFAKWHKAFTTAAKSRPELAEAVEGLEVVIPLVHPSLHL